MMEMLADFTQNLGYIIALNIAAMRVDFLGKL
jgi:hypothetical protein